MTKQEIEALKPGDKIYCPFTGEKWIVNFWTNNQKKYDFDILIVQNTSKNYKWFLTKDQLRRYIKIKE